MYDNDNMKFRAYVYSEGCLKDVWAITLPCKEAPYGMVYYGDEEKRMCCTLTECELMRATCFVGAGGDRIFPGDIIFTDLGRGVVEEDWDGTYIIIIKKGIDGKSHRLVLKEYIGRINECPGIQGSIYPKRPSAAFKDAKRLPAVASLKLADDSSSADVSQGIRHYHFVASDGSKNLDARSLRIVERAKSDPKAEKYFSQGVPWAEVSFWTKGSEAGVDVDAYAE
jgi:hypothetical protein